MFKVNSSIDDSLEVALMASNRANSVASRTTVGGCTFDELCNGVENYVCDSSCLVRLEQTFDVDTAVKSLCKKLEDNIQELEMNDRVVKSFYIGKTYIKKRRKRGGGFQRFDPMDPTTWRKKGISSRWGKHKSQGRHGLIVLTAVTRNTIPTNNQQEYALMLEQRVLHHYRIINEDPRLQNDTFSEGKRGEMSYGYALYAAFVTEQPVEQPDDWTVFNDDNAADNSLPQSQIQHRHNEEPRDEGNHEVIVLDDSSDDSISVPGPSTTGNDDDPQDSELSRMHNRSDVHESSPLQSTSENNDNNHPKKLRFQDEPSVHQIDHCSERESRSIPDSPLSASPNRGTSNRFEGPIATTLSNESSNSASTRKRSSNSARSLNKRKKLTLSADPKHVKSMTSSPRPSAPMPPPPPMPPPGPTIINVLNLDQQVAVQALAVALAAALKESSRERESLSSSTATKSDTSRGSK